jgi:predicted S18 family serine protease
MEQESKLFTIAKWVLALGVAWLSSFFVLGVVKGIVGLAVCAALGFVLVQAWPFFQFLVKNTVINLYKWRARQDPIGSAQTAHMEDQKDLRLFQEETIQIDKETSTYERIVRDLERDYPGDPETAQHQEQLQTLKDTVVQRREDEAYYAQALVQQEAGIRKLEAMWNASQIGNRAAKRASISKRQYQDLVKKTAFDTVQKSMDEARARLAAARARTQEQRDQRAALPPKAAHATIPVADVKDLVPARRKP